MRNAYRIVVGNPKGRRPLEDLGVDGKVILKCISGKIGLEGLDSINLSQDRDRWMAVVNKVINLRVP
jgi:hypothetical protein